MQLNPYFEVILASIIWGSTGVFIKVVNLPSTTLSFVRSAVPSAILLVYFLLKRKSLFQRHTVPLMIASGINAVRILLYFVGFTLTSIGNAVVIFYTTPIFASIMESYFLGRKLGRRKIGIILLAFVGLIIIYSNKLTVFASKDILGMTSVLAASILNAAMNVIFKKEIKNYTKLETIFYQNILAVFIFLPFLIINKPFPSLWQFEVSGIYAFLIGLFSYMLFYSAMKKISLSSLSVITYVEVVSAVFFAFIFLHEPVTWNMLIGAIFIIGSTILLKKIDATVGG